MLGRRVVPIINHKGRKPVSTVLYLGEEEIKRRHPMEINKRYPRMKRNKG